MIVRNKFNKIYRSLFTTPCRYIDIWGGRGRGGSHTGTEYFLHLITQPAYFRGYFIRWAFSDIRDSLFRDFKDRINDNPTIDIKDFHINENEMRIIYKPTGNIITSKGVKAEGGRTAKMKSLAGATHVMIEESEELGEDDFDTLDLSVRTMKSKKVQIIRIYNPPGRTHWIWRDYILNDAPNNPGYFVAEPKTNVNLLSIFSTYHDNIRNLQPSTIQKFESFKEKRPDYYFTVILGLISEGMRGRVYSGWQAITNDEFTAIEARSIIGQDFGSSSPAGCVECKIINQRLYLRELNYKPMTEKEIGTHYATLGLVNEIIVADSAEPLTIRRLRNGWLSTELVEAELEKYPQLLKGWDIYPAIKPPGSVNSGINKVKDMEVFVTEDSANLWNEYRAYKWALDKNKNPTDDPEDSNNHLLDAVRYVVTSKGRYY